MNSEIRQIYVDLDGTLIKTDLFFEAILKLIKKNPLYIFSLIFWILQGRPVAKEKVAERVDIEAENLPYQQELLDYLKMKKEQGWSLILATASHIRYAQKISDHLGIFDNIIATDQKNNMKGSRKLEEIQKLSAGNPFSYAGDSKADIPIWDAAHSNIFVNAPKSAIQNAKKCDKVEKVISTRSRSMARAFFKGMRPQQWAKNILVFVSLITAHQYTDDDIVITFLLAFVCFSLCASGVYFMNDLLDIEADRHHKTKHKRPIASGDLPIPYGIMGAIILPFLAFSIAMVFLRIEFVLVLAFYFIVTNLYSFSLKTISTADVMTLAVLYTLRVIAGAVAADIELSSWLLTYSIFLFVSLAYLKRYIEISSLASNGENAKGRGYSADDAETMYSLGTANITASIIVLALYLNSEDVMVQYHHPQILLMLCFLMLYWSNRIWVGARRGKITDDPVIFAIKDKVSRYIGVAFILTVLVAKFS